jgi:hypothetical protein
MPWPGPSRHACISAGTRAPAASSALTVRARDAHRALPERRHTVQPQDRVRQITVPCRASAREWAAPPGRATDPGNTPGGDQGGVPGHRPGGGGCPGTGAAGVAPVPARGPPGSGYSLPGANCPHSGCLCAGADATHIPRGHEEPPHVLCCHHGTARGTDQSQSAPPAAAQFPPRCLAVPRPPHAAHQNGGLEADRQPEVVFRKLISPDYQYVELPAGPGWPADGEMAPGIADRWTVTWMRRRYVRTSVCAWPTGLDQGRGTVHPRGE